MPLSNRKSNHKSSDSSKRASTEDSLKKIKKSNSKKSSSDKISSKKSFNLSNKKSDSGSESPNLNTPRTGSTTTSDSTTPPNTVRGGDEKNKRHSSFTQLLIEHSGGSSKPTLNKDGKLALDQGSAPDFKPIPFSAISDNLISDKSKKALESSKSITSLFEIQAKAFSPILQGKDVVGKAKTGCGKTLAFCLPIVERIMNVLLSGRERCEDTPKDVYQLGGSNSTKQELEQAIYRKRQPLSLCLAPTRELAKQIEKDFAILGNAHGLKSECLYGGTPFGPQCHSLRDGKHLIISTPGRLLDHIERRTIDLSAVRFLILDEADEMLSMGFQEDVDNIIKALPKPISEGGSSNYRVQKLLFSATLPGWVNDLVKKQLIDPVWVDVTDKSNGNSKGGATNKNIEHKSIFCPPSFKGDTIGDFVKVHAGSLFGKTIIFCDSKKEADELSKHDKLVQLGAGVLHGDIPQNQREVVMENFRTGKIKVLVATDVAARGLDVPCVDLVINNRPPQDFESYVHRSGRTGRAGNKGVSIVFYSKSDEYLVRLLQRKLSIKFKRVGPPQPLDIVRAAAKDSNKFLESIHEENVEAFLEQARLLIEERGAEEALAAAMAGLTGYTKRVQGRSLLSSFENATCVMISTSQQGGLENTGKVWYLLRQFLPSSMTQGGEIKSITLCADGHSAIFDVPSSYIENVIKPLTKEGQNRLNEDGSTNNSSSSTPQLWKGIEISIPKELPELAESTQDQWADEQQLREAKQAQYQKRKGGGCKGGGGGKGKGGGGGKGGAPFTGRGGGKGGKRSGPY